MSPQDLIQQYVSTGLAIPTHQFRQLNPNQLKTYLRQRLIAHFANSDEWITEDELIILPPDQLARLIDKSEPEQLANYLTMSRNTHKDENAKTLGSAAFNKFDASIIRALYSYNEYMPNTVTNWILEYKQNPTPRIIELMFKNAMNYRGENKMVDIIKRIIHLKLNSDEKTYLLFLSLLHYRSPFTVKILFGNEPFQNIDQVHFEELLEHYSRYGDFDGMVELIDSFKSNENVGLDKISDDTYIIAVSQVRNSLTDTIKMIELLGKERLLTIKNRHLYHIIFEFRPLEKRDKLINYLGAEIMARLSKDQKNSLTYDK
jgi:hypothetical protein